MPNDPVVHQAGEPDGLVQRCSRCGYVITDNRNVMVLESDKSGLCFWAAGPVTVWEGNPTQFAAGVFDNAVACDAKVN